MTGSNGNGRSLNGRTAAGPGFAGTRLPHAPSRPNGLAPNPPAKGRTVLVTGGGDYIGTVLTGRLLERGYNVRLLDRLYGGEGPLEAYAGRIEVEAADVRDILG
jgi:hypothetical protein